MGRRAILLLTTMAVALLMASGVALALTKTCLPGSTAAKPCYGSLYDDVITGWDPVPDGFNGSDYINAQNGKDYVEALGATDVVYGSLGPDEIHGDYDPKNWEDKNIEHGTNYGDDRLYGDNGDDWLYGGPGNDRLDGSTDNDTLKGQVGNDTLYGSVGNDYLYGGSGCDILYGSLGGDTIFANNNESCENNETTTDGKKIDDKVYGEDGNDRIITVGDSSNGKVDIIYCGFGDGDTVWKDPEDVVPVPSNCEVKGTDPLPSGVDE